ncbi:MAG: cobyrinate a,c-diamide synthase [Paracoccaceae bacterium]
MTPRFMIAATHKSSGKTVVTTGLARAMQQRGLHVQTFKKGPDYIDPMWLKHASGRPCYNLDFNTMTSTEIRDFFCARARDADITLIESNKGLFDGVDLHGTDSNAALAHLLKVPVVLVVDTTGTTRGIAPLLLGYQNFDANLRIAGVILNKVGGARHEAKLRAAVTEYTDLPVLGAVLRHPDLEIGERHLGLTTPGETGELSAMIECLGQRIGDSVDLDALERIAQTAGLLNPAPIAPSPHFATDLRIGIPRDAAFGFYYPDDLEAMEGMGAKLVFFDALTTPQLPDIDGLFIGGGFPETSAAALSANTGLMEDIRAKIAAGMPTYAECGGLMYLCKTLQWQGKTYPMVGAINGDAVMCERPQGRGYTRLKATPDCPWPLGQTPLKAHEFHYARIENLPRDTKFAFSLTRGAGITGAQDGIVVNNLLAGFCHMRNTSANPWVERFLRQVKKVR